MAVQNTRTRGADPKEGLKRGSLPIIPAAGEGREGEDHAASENPAIIEGPSTLPSSTHVTTI